jgi:hypothetical protein
VRFLRNVAALVLDRENFLRGLVDFLLEAAAPDRNDEDSLFDVVDLNHDVLEKVLELEDKALAVQDKVLELVVRDRNVPETRCNVQENVCAVEARRCDVPVRRCNGPEIACVVAVRRTNVPVRRWSVPVRSCFALASGSSSSRVLLLHSLKSLNPPDFPKKDPTFFADRSFSESLGPRDGPGPACLTRYRGLERAPTASLVASSSASSPLTRSEHANEREGTTNVDGRTHSQSPTGRFLQLVALDAVP